MNYVRDLYAARKGAGRPLLSFEFFPAKTEEGERTLLEKTIPTLLKLRPDFCSVTYGAGGGTREKTLATVERIQNRHGVPMLCHVTCVNATVAETGAVVDDAARRGINNFLALRGDPPGGGEFQKTPGGFEFAAELTAWLRAKGRFCIGVAGFPEGHMACKAGKYADWEYLKRKIDAGGDFVLTQLFYDNAFFLEFYEHLRGKLHVTVPVSPGVLPIFSFGQITHITKLCGARLPEALVKRLAELDGNDEALAAFGVEYATRQCEELLKAGVPGLHLYTLNKAKYVTQVVRNLGLV
ncbi:MAG: methylenetetrahydrofolate reductase [Planctomycetota bacterium]